MQFALELRGIVKQIHAGFGACRATCAVLRGIDLSLCPGDAVVVAGAHGSGKSTLLLCAAGLIVPDAGEVAWFGERSRTAAELRASYYPTRTSVPRTSRPSRTADLPRVHLVDARITPPMVASVAQWIAQRRDCGDAVVVTTADESVAGRLPARVLVLRDGRLSPCTTAQTARARVAERVRFC